MKKALFSLLITFVAFSFNSCSSSDDEDNNPDYKITIVMVMATEQISGSTKFLPGTMYFYKVATKVTGSFSITNKTYTIDGVEKQADQIAKVGELGTQQSYLDSNSKYIIIYEATKYPNTYKESYIEIGNVEKQVVDFKWN